MLNNIFVQSRMVPTPLPVIPFLPVCINGSNLMFYAISLCTKESHFVGQILLKLSPQKLSFWQLPLYG